jgi:hypothetical protein
MDDPRAPSGSDNTDKQEWLARLEDVGDEPGYFKPLGNNHYAVLTEGSSTLLVTFETVESIRKNTEDEMPLGFELIAEKGWSHLGILSEGCTWFRSRSVYDYFDSLLDEGFFEEFDHVVFMGSGMCGYAAAAYSVAAPGCTVLVFNPQATLDPRVTEWDHRFKSSRRVSFTDRYGFAPDMIEAANQVFLLYDPEEELDAMHAALFTRPHVTKLRCRFLGRDIMKAMIQMDILQPLVDAACEDMDVAKRFRQLYRARHEYAPYLGRVLTHLDDDDRCIMSGMLCRYAASRVEAPRFKERLEKIETRLKSAGKTLPNIRRVRKNVAFQPLD